MIWIIFIIIIVIASAILAIRSMKDYDETPDDPSSYELFLIRDLKDFNEEIISRFHSFLLSLDTFFSIERLYKGKESVIVLYGPKAMKKSFPELKLLELEDYLKDPKDNNPAPSKVISSNDAYSWVVKKPASKKVSKSDFLKMELLDNQFFFWQIICSPLKNSNQFQVTIRAMVSDKDAPSRIELVKKYEASLKNHAGFITSNSGQTASSIFDSFKKRTLIPKEISPFIVGSQDILHLLDV